MRTIAQASEQSVETIAKGLKNQREPLRNKKAMETIARPGPLQQIENNKATNPWKQQTPMKTVERLLKIAESAEFRCTSLKKLYESLEITGNRRHR